MRRAAVTVGMCVMLLSAGAALAAPPPQVKCDSARVAAWRKYQACVGNVAYKDAKVVGFDQRAAFAKCRHKYFGRWAKFQSYVGSTCVGPRFTDNGDQTVTDNLSGLVWEKKDDAGLVHDKDNAYTWSSGMQAKEDGTAFTSFLTGAVTGLNVAAFGGASGWRLPKLAELQTIMLDFECKGDSGSPTCSCPSHPCIDPALDAGNTLPGIYWSNSVYVAGAESAWVVDFFGGPAGWQVVSQNTWVNSAVRAVRGGQ